MFQYVYLLWINNNFTITSFENRQQEKAIIEILLIHFSSRFYCFDFRDRVELSLLKKKLLFF